MDHSWTTLIPFWLSSDDVFCPTLTKGSNWQITQIRESDVFRLDLACSTSIPSLEQKHSSCWKIFKSRYNDIALMSVYLTDTFCSFTKNVISRVASYWVLSLYGSIVCVIPPVDIFNQLTDCPLNFARTSTHPLHWSIQTCVAILSLYHSLLIKSNFPTNLPKPWKWRSLVLNYGHCFCHICPPAALGLVMTE